jgi:hypothetical protein
MAQYMNYPKAIDLHICLLLNFAIRHLEVKRIVHKLIEPIDKATT